MSKGRFGALLCVFSLTFHGCGEKEYPNTAEGQFLRNCARCHEADGSSKTATRLAKSPIDLRDPRLHKELSDGEIAYIMRFGVGRMQGIPDLEPEVVDSILVYVRSLVRKD